MRLLSAYRLMWLQVIFDLPVQTKRQRKKATDFRNSLLDLGFEMEQYSVYLRSCPDKNTIEGLINKLTNNLPSEGKIKMLTFTDKQYENIRSFNGYTKEASRKNRAQLQLF